MRRNSLRFSRSTSVSVSASRRGQPRRVGDQRQLAEHGARAGMADGDALAVPLAVEHDAPADHDIARIGRRVLPRKGLCRRTACMLSAPKASSRSCSCVNPSKRLTPDRMRISSSSGIVVPGPRTIRPGSRRIGPDRAQVDKIGPDRQRVTNRLCRQAWLSPVVCGPTLRKSVRAPACIRRFLSQEFQHWKDRARSSGASGKRGFPAYGW